ncbi:MAG: hypothetical protein HS116_18365 [Planctomycetes bacterium]|nr:hypothetical protein [Planctomycetota bacterium]
MTISEARDWIEMYDGEPPSSIKLAIQDFIEQLKPSNEALDLLLFARENKTFEYWRLDPLIESMDEKMFARWTTACDLAAASGVC